MDLSTFIFSQGGCPLFKAKLTQSLFSDFSASYQSFSTSKKDQNSPFVYADQDGVRLLANMIEDGESDEGVFAMSVAQDGVVEMLALYEA